MVFPTSIIIGPSPLKILGNLALLASAIIAGVGLLIPVVGFLTAPGILDYFWIIMAGTGVLVMCYTGTAVLGALIWGRPCVEIGPHGFVEHGVFGHRWRRWSEIEGRFVVIRVYLRPTVAYELTEDFKGIARMQPNASLAGYDETISTCGELAIGATALAEILNRWKHGAASELSEDA
jgi:hypothetical protein